MHGNSPGCRNTPFKDRKIGEGKENWKKGSNQAD
jgi:hypothetical protein